MDDDIAPFLRRVFLDKAKKLENKASLGKVAQGKAVEGKAAKGKAVKVNLQKVKLQKVKLQNTKLHKVWILESFLNSYHWCSKVSEVIPKCLAWTKRKGLKSNYSASTNFERERDENWCRKLYDYFACKEKSKQVDNRDGFTRDDEPDSYVGQVACGASDRVKDSYEVMKDVDKSSARAQVEETKLPREIAMSVRDDVGVLDVATDDNAKATSVRDDVGVPDAAADDNAKATSVCNDIDEADVAVNDNVKTRQLIIDNGDIFIKDAHDIINHANPPIHGFQIILLGGLEKNGDGLDEAKAN
ncbi:hypothetical protein Tco_1307481 [Tanacetum coccineum]